MFVCPPHERHVRHQPGFTGMAGQGPVLDQRQRFITRRRGAQELGQSRDHLAMGLYEHRIPWHRHLGLGIAVNMVELHVQMGGPFLENPGRGVFASHHNQRRLFARGLNDIEHRSKVGEVVNPFGRVQLHPAVAQVHGAHPVIKFDDTGVLAIFRMLQFGTPAMRLQGIALDRVVNAPNFVPRPTVCPVGQGRTCKSQQQSEAEAA